MKNGHVLGSIVLVAFACGCHPDASVERTKVAVVEFSVAPNAVIEDYDGNAASLGMPVAEAVAEEIRDEDSFDAQAIAQTVPPEGDLIVRGEITHVYGGNLAVQMTVLFCWFCGWWKGEAVVGVQGQVVRRDGTVVGLFSDEKIGGSAAKAAEEVGKKIGEMVKEAKYEGGHPGNDGYLAAPAATEPAARQRTVSDRLQELDQLRAKGLISDEEYAAQRRRLIGEL
jgi:hypothetical protein